MKRQYIFAALALFISSMAQASADSSECKKLDQVAQQSPGFHPTVSFTVTGKDRLYFHSAPSKKCKHKNIFVIPRDSLTAYVAHEGWIYVMYINSKTGEDFMGWVEESRLQYGGKNAPF